MNEWNEGMEYFADDPISNSTDEKLSMSAILGRTEEKKMPILPGIDMSKPHGNKLVYQEFPRALFHRKLGTRVVQNDEEKKKLLQEGWALSPAKFNKEESLLKRISELEEELASTIVEYEKLTGKDYGNELAKIKKQEKVK